MGMMEALQRYDISRGVPFLVFKELPAMNAVHTYIRTMRTGYTAQSSYVNLRVAKLSGKGYRCGPSWLLPGLLHYPLLR